MFTSDNGWCVWPSIIMIRYHNKYKSVSNIAGICRTNSSGRCFIVPLVISQKSFRGWNQHSSAAVYHKNSNIGRALVGSKIADRSDVVGASHVAADPTTFQLHSRLNNWFQYIEQ